VDIVIEKHPSPPGVSCNFLVTNNNNNNNNTDTQSHSYFDAQGKNYTDGA